MLLITLSGANTKAFMNCLFKSEAFDTFCVREFVVCSWVRFEITGDLLIDDESAAEQKKHASWGELKPYALSFVKGVKPSLMRAVFSVMPAVAEEVHPNAAALFLNMGYENDIVRLTCATSPKEFALNKDLDQRWEAYITNFINNLDIKIDI